MKIRIGLVSNSSSSSFVCNTKLTLREVRQRLIELVSFYDLFCDKDIGYYEMFIDPYIADLTYISSIKDYTDSIYGILGSVIIDSTSDNTIPYILFDLIEAAFDAHRIHLG